MQSMGEEADDLEGDQLHERQRPEDQADLDWSQSSFCRLKRVKDRNNCDKWPFMTTHEDGEEGDDGRDDGSTHKRTEVKVVDEKSLRKGCLRLLHRP